MTTGEHSVEELAGRIRKRPYSVISNNCLIKSVGIARHCTRMGVEAKVVACLAYFYAEVLGKQYEVSREPDDENHSKPKVLVKLGGFQLFFEE